MIYNFHNLTFQILSTDRFEHKKGFFKVQGRPFAALGFRISGYCNFKINGTSFISRPGDITFIAENTDYEAEYSDGVSIAVHFTDCNYKNCENIATKNNSKIFYDLFSQLFDKKFEINSINSEKALVYNILQLLSDSEMQNGRDTSFEKCLSFININYCNPQICTDEVCKAGNISKATLRRKFQKHCGVSPKQYLLKLRLDKAVTMLINNEYSIKEISAKCGFNDEKFFSKTIKKHYGISPSKFAEKR